MNPQKNDYVNFKYFTNALKELIELLEYETQLLQNHKSHLITELQIKKNDLITYIENQKQNLQSNRDSILDLSARHKSEINYLAQKLHEVSLTNKDELSKEMYFKSEIIQIVSQLINKQVHGISYDRHGRIDKLKMKKSPPSISINDKI